MRRRRRRRNGRDGARDGGKKGRKEGRKEGRKSPGHLTLKVSEKLTRKEGYKITTAKFINIFENIQRTSHCSK